MKIGFICTGNTCRSSMAEGIAKHLAKQMGVKAAELVFLSAGVAAFPGLPASDQAVQAMHEKGIDLSHHQAAALTPQLLDELELVLVMTNRHKEAILSMRPEAQNKVYLLAEFAQGTALDIVDPFGQSVAVYRACANQLEELIAQAIIKVLDQK